MANVGPRAWYLDSAQYANVAAWAASHSYAAGALVRQLATPTVNNERVFVCIVAGTSGGSEPTWVVTKGAKTTDSAATWMEVTGQPGVNGDAPQSITASTSPVTSGGPNVVILTSNTKGALPGMYICEPAGSGSYFFNNNTLVLSVVPNVSITVASQSLFTGNITSGTVFYVGNCPMWQTEFNSAGMALGLVIYDQVTSSLQIVTTAGTSGSGAQPSFSGTAGVTTTDNTVTWTSLGAASNFGAWAAPHARLAAAFATNWGAAGNTFFVGDDHAATQASALTITSPGTAASPCLVYCVDHTAALPPGSANVLTTPTGSESCTGSNNGLINGVLCVSGMIFNAGSGAVSANWGLANGGNSGFQRFDNCLLAKLGTSAQAAAFSIGAANAIIYLNNTPLKFGSTGDGIKFNQAKLVWKNTPSAIAGTAPNSLFAGNGTNEFAASLTGVDLSAITVGPIVVGGTAQVADISFLDCKVASSIVIASTPASPFGPRVDFITSDSSGTSYRQERYYYEGTLAAATTIVRTGGSSDGVTPISWSLATTANASWFNPFPSFPIAIWNTTLTTNRGVTAHGIWNSASLPNNDQIWLEAEYQGASGSPLGSLATQTKANGLATGTALTADSASTWSSGAAARANSTVYTTGQSIAVAGASGGGGLFFCTAGGTSASSQPGGYASAVDGGSVTDGTATFLAGVRFVLTVTLSSPQPALTGYIYGTVKVGAPSVTFYVDPLLTLS